MIEVKNKIWVPAPLQFDKQTQFEEIETLVSRCIINSARHNCRGIDKDRIGVLSQLFYPL